LLHTKKFYFILVSSIIILSFISFIITFTSINITTKKNIQDFEKQIIEEKKSELLDRAIIVSKIIETNYKSTLSEVKIKKAQKIAKIRMNTLFNIISHYYKKNHTSHHIKDNIKLIVENATYNPKKFYFWINDLTPKMIVHPIIKKLNNKNLKNYKDVNGKYIFDEIIKIVKNDKEGFIKYYWINPKNNKLEKKISYVKLFKPLKWVIGTGVYISDNTSIIQKKTLKEIKNAIFGTNGYFWVNDMSYKMIMHPIKPQYDGKIFINTPKVPFVELGVNALKKSKKDYAFIQYKFYNPATKKYERKLSIVKLFKPWNWVIGTGVYLVDVDKTIEKMQKEAHQEVMQIIKFLIILNILAITIILFIAKNILNKYEELATKDKLTNIYNRLKIDEVLEEHFEIAKRYKKDLSIIFFDIDHFKKVNDIYGHKVGDYILQELVKIVSKNIRKTDIFGRWGGEEFIIILPETDLNQAYKVAEKLRKTIENYKFKFVDKITCSFGVINVSEENSINELIEEVDKLLYLSKENGRNQVTKKVT